MKYKRITYEDRIKIEAYLKLKIKPIKIAELLGVSRQAISYELKKGKYQRLTSMYELIDAYSADIAQQKTDFEASSKGPQLKIGKDYDLVKSIENLLSDDFSPKASYTYKNGNVTKAVITEKGSNYLSKEKYVFKYGKTKTNDIKRYGEIMARLTDQGGLGSELPHVSFFTSLSVLYNGTITAIY